MKDITELFSEVFMPVKAFVVYHANTEDERYYVEAYDMNLSGKMVNAHPLTIEESTAFANALDSSGELSRSFLCSKGLLPENILYIDPRQNGYAVWHTPAQTVPLLFVEGLGIPCGKAAIPSLVWKADKQQVQVFAVKGNGKPLATTPLYHAPFHNIYKDGKVCMGTVQTDAGNAVSLEAFIKAWEGYFFGSYFSHLIQNVCPVKSDIKELWRHLIETGEKFPEGEFIKTGKTIKDLLA